MPILLKEHFIVQLHYHYFPGNNRLDLPKAQKLVGLRIVSWRTQFSGNLRIGYFFCKWPQQVISDARPLLSQTDVKSSLYLLKPSHDKRVPRHGSNHADARFRRAPSIEYGTRQRKQI